MKYWEIDIWKVRAFNLLNEEVEGITIKGSQNLVNVKRSS